jgi:hypothetical protein
MTIFDLLVPFVRKKHFQFSFQQKQQVTNSYVSLLHTIIGGTRFESVCNFDTVTAKCNYIYSALGFFYC